MKFNSETLMRMREFAQSVVSNLASQDSRLSGSVKVAHPDGSSSVIACAYPTIMGEWLCVFSLIDGFVLFHKGDVTSWRQQSEFIRTKLGHSPAVQSESTAARRLAA